MITYGIYPTTVIVNGEPVNICPESARKSLDCTKWICHDPQCAPRDIEALWTLSLEEAQVLMMTPEWSNEPNGSSDV